MLTEQEKLTLTRIIGLLKEKKISKREFCQYLNVSPSNFGNWVSGRNTSYMKYIHAIASFLDVSIDYLLGKENATLDADKTNVVDIEQENVYMIPVFESVSAGFGALAHDVVIDYEPLYIRSESEAKETICIRVKGDSMFPLIDDGDTIQVHKQTSVDSGAIAVVLLDGEEALVKKVIYGETWIELHSINPMYKTMRFENENVLRLKVLGQVKKIIKIC
ncbi:MAG: helix-turn-helix domain-containing protein [Clostridia bacterium]|nr:helix-turn-helix domain-containing protein [Clostridia bacterium]